MEFLVGGGLLISGVQVGGPAIDDYFNGVEPECPEAHDAVQGIKPPAGIPPELRADYYDYMDRQLKIARRCDMNFGR